MTLVKKSFITFINAVQNGSMAVSIFMFYDFSQLDSHTIAKGAHVME